MIYYDITIILTNKNVHSSTVYPLSKNVFRKTETVWENNTKYECNKEHFHAKTRKTKKIRKHN